MTRLLVFIFTISLLVSCKKKVTKSHNEFVGYWENGSNGIYINSSSFGYTYEIKDNKISNHPESKNWYIKNDKLLWGTLGARYFIDKYPTTSETQLDLISDTIKVGQRYMKLDGSFYLEKTY